MRKRHVGVMIFGIATLGAIGYAIYNVMIGNEIGFTEIFVIALLSMTFLSAMTWGTKQEKDGIRQDEELGRKITEKSSKISYLILVCMMIIAVFIDQAVNGTTNIFLLGMLGLAMILLPFVEFLVARKYQ